MCLAVPMKITGIDGFNATCEAKGIQREVSLFMLQGEPVAVGDHVLIHVGYAIQKVAEDAGFGVVRDWIGHGVGRTVHEDPEVPNYGKPGTKLVLKPGMTIAIEPMINAGTPDVIWMDDDWTVVTADHALSAHYENTILITDGKPEILSLTEEEKKAGFLNLF